MNAEDLSLQLREKDARWTAKDNPVGDLTNEEKKGLLGAVPSREATKIAEHPPQAPAPAFAPEVDWRNYKSGNHVTPVKNQGGCGSCVSFGCCGVVESMAHIEATKWTDLSEADSHFCSSHGADCTGWWPDECFDEIRGRGVCGEAAFQYRTAFPNNDIWSSPPQCQLPANHDKIATRITSRVALSNSTAAKNHLTSTGPVAGCFTVYDDFFYYNSGVYHHVSGQKAGGHCVLVIGYSEAGQYWICKNSWHTTWGEQGYFRIAYADFIFEARFYPMYGAAGVQFP